ncbi:3-oxoacyl-ACP synthase [Escherichia coli]|uniref:3-oxoacyl-ACP synthase n=1 Tax=Escherichia coli TaxID=562 RepID=A0A377DFP1_ECOLX|nr:3-oxoacyl-ACP synthase [Escherichia coli]
MRASLRKLTRITARWPDCRFRRAAPRVSRCSALTQCAARAALKAVGPYVVTKAMASGVSACLATPFKIHGVKLLHQLRVCDFRTLYR